MTPEQKPCNHAFLPNATGSNFICSHCGISKPGTEVKLRDLGTMNDWPQNKYPREYWHCVGEKHQRDSRTTGRCLTQYSCKICKITYAVDSSD